MSIPESVGMSSSRLARLHQVMKRRYVDSGLLPGILTQVYRRGELLTTGASGYMDVARGKPMREDAIFRIYSMTKPITGVLLMMAVEEGLIGLDDDVHLYIPSWKDLGVYVSGMPTIGPRAQQRFVTRAPTRRMKVIDLCTHTSGLTYDFMNRTPVDAAYREQQVLNPSTPGGLDGMIEQLAALPLEFSPGESWNYSVSMDVMGYLVQKLYGAPLSEVMRTRLLEPLRMHDTAFYCPREKTDRFASCYQLDAAGKLQLFDDARDSICAMPPVLEAGGHGLLSTAHDYMRFCRMLLQGGVLDDVRILSPKTVELFSLNHLPGNGQIHDFAPPGLFRDSGYAGLGFSITCAVNVDVAKTRVAGTTGEFFWGGAASTAFWVDPREELAVVFMSQVLGSNHSKIRQDLRTLVYAAMTESFA